MIRLYNHTRHPDKPIKDILAFAARVIGVRGDVCVKVTRSLRPRPGAYSNRAFPSLGFMRGTKRRAGRDGILIGDLPGYIVLHLPSSQGHSAGWLDICEWFAHCALHEMAHIRQFRENRYHLLRQDEAKRSQGRRMAHDRRPCEIDAENRIYDAMTDNRNDRRRQDLVIALAVAIESNEWLEPTSPLARLRARVEKLFEEALLETTAVETLGRVRSRLNSDRTSGGLEDFAS